MKKAVREWPWGLIGFFFAVLLGLAITVAIAWYDPAPRVVPPTYPTAYHPAGADSLSWYDR